MVTQEEMEFVETLEKKLKDALVAAMGEINEHGFPTNMPLVLTALVDVAAEVVAQATIQSDAPAFAAFMVLFRRQYGLLMTEHQARSVWVHRGPVGEA